jgi:hypothetical protein
MPCTRARLVFIVAEKAFVLDKYLTISINLVGYDPNVIAPIFNSAYSETLLVILILRGFVHPRRRHQG